MDREEFFELADRLPIVKTADLLGDGGAVVVAPHPDDESLGCGILIARAAAEGRDIRIIVLSDGTGSHRASKAYPPDKLRALREDEACAAVETLGIEANHLIFLRLPDGQVPSVGSEARRAADRVAHEAWEAAAMFVTWRRDPHCDHQAAYRIARAAQRQTVGLRLFEYSVWGRDLPLDGKPRCAPRGWRLPAAEHRDRKSAAISCYRSQITDLIADDPQGFRLDPSMVARLIVRDEVFLEMDP